MFEHTSPSLALRIKKYGYWLSTIPLLLLISAYALTEAFGHGDIFAWFPVFFVYVAVPILDHLIGKDPSNPDESQVPALQEQNYYKILTLLNVPMQIAMLIGAAWMFCYADLSIIGRLGWLVSLGVVSAVSAINVGHELVHKNSRLEQWAGGILFSLVCYGSFKVEHVRGHHVNVSTPKDASSARFGQSVYQFLPHAFKWNFLNAWSLEAKRLARQDLPAFHWRNELIWWYSLSAIVGLGMVLAFGPWGLLFFLGQAFIACAELEVINYIEHYGLERRLLENGKYERTTHQHSWNANHLLTNLILFQLQRHSDHHANPKRRYQTLRHFDDSPQLPYGYATMVLIAMVPPLWKKIIDPRVNAYYGRATDHITPIPS